MGNAGKGEKQMTYPGITVKDIDIVAGVEIIDGTLTIDFEGVWTRLSIPTYEGDDQNCTHARPS